MSWAITVKFPAAVKDFVDSEAAARPMENPSDNQIIRELVAEAIAARASKGRK